MEAQLRVISGPFAGETISIGDRKFIIGREQDCRFRPDSEFVSRHHCVLLLDEYTLRIRDLGSKNGTYVNGHRISGDMVLSHDDMISLGELTMQVNLERKPAPRSGSETINPALMGTDIFDGNTLPTNTQKPAADSVPSPPTGDTQHMPQPDAAGGNVSAR